MANRKVIKGLLEDIKSEHKTRIFEIMLKERESIKNIKLQIESRILGIKDSKEIQAKLEGKNEK